MNHFNFSRITKGFHYLFRGYKITFTEKMKYNRTLVHELDLIKNL